MLIHFIGIIGLSARVVGTRTKKLGSSISLFNLLIIVSSFAQSIQIPLLTKSIELSINSNKIPDISIFRIILLCSSVGAILGALILPTAHRFMAKGVEVMYIKGSIIQVIIHSFKYNLIKIFFKSITIPQFENINRLKRFRDLNVPIIILNAIVYAFVTVSVIACLYAGCLNIAFRTTALALSGLAVGLGSLLMLVFIEPYNSTLTDKVIDGTVSEGFFRRHLVYIILARILGTFIAQLYLFPISSVMAYLSKVF
jgi:hypothetical protein